MKNFTLTVFFFLSFVFSAAAQQTPSTPALDQASSNLTRVMMQNMGLNEDEYIKLKALNQERLSKATEADKLYADDQEQRDVRLREIEDEFEVKLFNMLNTRQVTAYAEFKQKPEANYLAIVQQLKASPKK